LERFVFTCYNWGRNGGCNNGGCKSWGGDCVGGDCGLNDACLIPRHDRSIFIVDGLCDWNLYMGSIGDSSGSSHGISMGMMTSRGWGCEASRCQKWEEDQLIHF
jgi:hypothetical protein